MASPVTPSFVDKERERERERGKAERVQVLQRLLALCAGSSSPQQSEALKASTKHQAAKRCVYDGFHGLVQSLSSTCQTAKKCTLANVLLEKLEKFNKPRR